MNTPKIGRLPTVVSLLPAKRVMQGLGGTGTGPIRRWRALWGRFHSGGSDTLVAYRSFKRLNVVVSVRYRVYGVLHISGELHHDRQGS